jgi:predicted RNA-binding protein with PIN domain
MYISKKPTLYIIDGHNFVRSCLMAEAGNEEETTKEFLDWLEEMSETENYYDSFFRVIFDGTFRPLGATLRRAVKVTFAEELTADELIYEQAQYLYNTGERIAVVSSDRTLQEDLKNIGVKTIFCHKFFNMLNKR